MNSIDRIMAAVQFGNPDRTPVIAQVFGHAAVQSGVPVCDYLRDGTLLARCQIDAWRRYGYDAVFAFMDAGVETEAVGSKLEFFSDQYSEVASYAITADTDIATLTVPDPERAGRMPELLKAARIMRREIGDEVLVVGIVLGPMSVAVQLLGIEAALYMAADRPKEYEELLDFTARITTRFGEAQLAAGVHLCLLFEPAGSPEVVPPYFFRELLLPRIKAIFTAFKGAGSAANWLHITGPSENILRYFPDAGAEIVNLDYLVDPFFAKQQLPRTCLDGNVKPLTFVTGTPEEVAAESHRLIGMFADRGGFILSSGCEIPFEAKPENISALVSAARA